MSASEECLEADGEEDEADESDERGEAGGDELGDEDSEDELPNMPNSCENDMMERSDRECGAMGRSS